MQIKKLTDREHIVLRPSMYIGSVSNEQHQVTIFDGNRATLQQKTFPPGLIKIINEVIDNSVDAILKTGVGDKIQVQITNDTVTVSDNSTGFPLPKNINNIKNNDEIPVILALGNARAGSNFNDQENIGQMGTNGVGAFATNCFSTKFRVDTINSNYLTTAIFEENAILKKVAIELTAEDSGTTVTFTPDLAKFGLDSITQDIQDVVYSRLVTLALTYKNISFYYNKTKIKTPKNIADYFVTENPYVTYKTEDFEILVIANNEKTNHFSVVNGLTTPDGGTHIDLILNDLANRLANVKGLKCTKADINNTLQIVFVARGWKNLRFNSQTKEKITNSTKETREFIGDLEPLYQKVLKSKQIKDYLKATTRAREIRSDNKALKDAKKTKIKSDKFLDAQDTRDILMLVEGDSAMGGLVPALGRKNIAYYALKGKPLNAYKSSAQKVAANKELSELLAIVHQNNFEKIVFGTDQDLDGYHIRGLLLGFVTSYLPEYLDKIFFLQTPVRGVTKNGKLVRWSFNLSDDLKIKTGERSQYYKGLGTWDREDLKQVVEQNGLDGLLSKIDIDQNNPSHQQALESWLGDDSQKRKDLIIENNFSIAKI